MSRKPTARPISVALKCAFVLIQPKAEGEIAFLLRKQLIGGMGGCTVRFA